MENKMKCDNSINRRNFIKTSVTGALGAAVLKNPPVKQHPETVLNERIKEYRTLGRTGFKVSDISFGAVDTSTPEVLYEALSSGMNYIDTAEGYGRGRSEKAVGEVLKKFERKKIFVTTKIALHPRMGAVDKEGIKERTYKCLERLQTDYVDCMMIHMCQAENVKDENFHSAMKELKAEGKVRFLGLSNHGKQQSISGPTKDTMDDVIKAAAEDGRFDVVLFAYNFILREPGETILKICKDKNIGTTLMKTDPVHKYKAYSEMVENAKKSGREIPDFYIKMLKEYGEYAGRSEDFRNKYGLKNDIDVRNAAAAFLLNNPDVHTITMTFGNFEKLRAYIALSGTRLDEIGMGVLNDYESKLGKYYCRHACGICESSCPHNVPVNTIMRYNHYFEAQGREKTALLKYSSLQGAKADKCMECSGACEKVCPYNVPVQGLLNIAHSNLSVG